MGKGSMRGKQGEIRGAKKAGDGGGKPSPTISVSGGADPTPHLSQRGMVSSRQKVIAVVVVIGAFLGAYGLYIALQPAPEPTPTRVVTDEGVELRKLSNTDLQRELQMLLFQKKFASAEQLVRYQEDPDSYAHQLMLVGLYMNQNELDHAREVLIGMGKQYTGKWQIPRTLGDVYMRQQRVPEALGAYRQARELLKTDTSEPMQRDELYLLDAAIKKAGG